MSVEAKDGLRFILTPRNSLDDPFESQTEWPRLSCPQANQLALEFGDLRVDGKVGIGTTATTEKLEVAGKVKATDLDVSGAIA
ncbi:MAG: polymer-forming cytoskeletal protein, partial [Moorea sp. SIO2I5]|nr:polymer-forming cytoskeletal protein [Moorena sp. SIO2I5]